MSYQINTNIASLQSQEYLRVNSEFQAKTINRVTSGLRIISSGDDAAGLAIANTYRSDQAVLSQGVRNANDGLSQLQIADGGINNISKLLDRARTLATQSASGTFTGDRNLLNSEFASVLGEIDRQAQAIGLDQGGTFATNLRVFIGGGKANTTTAISNGSVAVDLSQSTVDSKSLGLKGVQTIGVAGTDIGTGAASTKVSDVLANTTNTASEATGGFTDFYFQGPGFGDSSRIKVSVNLTGVTDTGTLVNALNTAIQNAGNGATQSATAFKNANITAGIATDVNGAKQLTFNASATAFQVEAGDKVSQALLGHFEQNASLTGTDAAATLATNGAAATRTLNLTIDGVALAGIVVTSSAATSKAQIVRDLNNDGGFSNVATASLSGDQLVLKSKGNSATSSVAVTSTTLFSTSLGLSATPATAATASTGADLSTQVQADGNTASGVTTFGATGAGSVVFRFQGSGLTSPVDVTLTTLAGTTVTQAISDLSSQVANNATLKAAGISLTTATAGDALVFTSTKGEKFDVATTGDIQNRLGAGSFVAGLGGSFDYSTLTGATSYNSPAGTAAGTANIEFSINGAASSGNLVSIDLGAGNATAASVSATANAGTVSIDASNNTLNVNINHVGVAITLSSSPTATLNDIAAQITTQLDASALGAGVASASIVANQLVITTTNKGAQQSIQIAAGSANTALGLSVGLHVGTARSGDDVATALNAAFTANSTLQVAGLTADYNGGTSKITISSNNGTFFRADAYGGSLAAKVAGTNGAGTAATSAVQGGAAVGPTYNITSANDTISFALSAGGTQTISLLHGSARTADQIVSDINLAITNGGVASNDGSGHVQIKDAGVTGVASSVTFSAFVAATSGTIAAATLGPYAIGSDVSGASGGTVAATFDTTGGANTLAVVVDGGSVQAVTLTAGAAVTLQAVVNDINNTNAGAGLVGAHASVIGGRVVITSNAGGVASSVKLNASTGATAIGFDLLTHSGTAGANNVLSVKVDGGATQQVHLTGGAARTAAQILADINAINGGTGLVGATASVTLGVLSITSNSTGLASTIQYDAATDTVHTIINVVTTVSANATAAVDSAHTVLGLTTGAATLGSAAGTGPTVVTGSSDTLAFTIDGTAATVTLAAGATTADSAVTQINTQLNAALGTVAQVYASKQNDRLQIASLTTGTGSSVAIAAGNANTAFGFSVGTTQGSAADLGDGIVGSTFVTGNTATAAPAVATQIDSGGANQSSAFTFTPVAYGGDDQTISLTASDTTGAPHSLSTILHNDATNRSGGTIDSAISAINTALQQSNDTTLQKVVAVKDNASGVEKIRFLDASGSFKVSVGTTANATGIGSQGTTTTSTLSNGGSTADISTQSAALSAVNVLATAVASLGSAQAVVGRGQNQFNYAINLAQSQLSNLASAESRIRDADLASEAANLTKAQILLQAGVAALAQANSAPQAVLALLRG